MDRAFASAALPHSLNTPDPTLPLRIVLPWPTLCLLALTGLSALAQTASRPAAGSTLTARAPLAPGEAPPLSFSESETATVRERLRTMACLIDKTDHPVTESYIRGYMLRNREKSEAILGRAPAYFPLFEEELRRAGLPEDLKYLAVVESALDPRARSRSGAGGLWQFMPGTAAMFGLQVNRGVDERSDVEKSTRAAVRFLKEEYARFGDWALVLAAYNGGPGRVRRAMRRSGKRTFWEIRRYLPRETRNYVPAFVAATYLHKYGDLHGLTPRPLTLDEQLACAVACPLGMTLAEVAQACALPLERVEAMNPHARGGEVPPGASASVRVPRRVRAAMATYVGWRASGAAPELVAAVRARPIDTLAADDGAHFYRRHSRTLAPGEHPGRHASREDGVSAHHLAVWNPHLARGAATYAQALDVYAPRFEPATPFDEPEKLTFTPMGARPLHKFYVAPPPVPARLDVRLPDAEYRLARHETLLGAYQRFATTMTWGEFVRWNGLDPEAPPRAGTVLAVRTGR